ncbi:MAG: hypothetical protein COC01_00125 [Bacteroidetes bacterium]|nr:MAG: hypothetical protein COC01_00125 [Bacteroidota bacterium]
MFTGILHLHVLTVMLFIIIHLTKVVLMMFDKEEALEKVSKMTKVPHMIIGTLLLLTGIFLAMNSGSLGQWFWMKLGVFVVAIPMSIIGLKKKNKALSLISLMMFIYIYGMSETKNTSFTKNEANPTETQLTDGKAIYMNYCQNCHGKDGTLGLSGAADLQETEMHLEQMKEIISNGKNAMIAYNNILTPEQIQKLAEYVQTLGQEQ